jgi:hypothetical protein
MPPRKKKKPERFQHTYRCLADVEEALQKYRAGLEYDPGENEIIDRAVRAFLRLKGYEKLAERQRPPDE